VVSCESDRIAFSTYPAMMGLPVMEGNIKDAYLQAHSSKKHTILFADLNLDWRIKERNQSPLFRFLAVELQAETT